MRSSALLFGLIGLASLAIATLPALSESPVEQRLRQLREQRTHSENGPTRAATLDRKIAGMDTLDEEWPTDGHTDRLAQILYEMKVPADREYPEYQPGYQARELGEARLHAKAPGVPLPWIERGPGNLAGGCRGLLVDPIDPTGNTWFVGSVGGGVWWTDDAGANWTLRTTDPQSYSIPTLAQNGDVIYAGTGDSFFSSDAMNGNGILKSVDRGLNWTPLASTLDDVRFNNITRMVVNPSDPDVVVVAANIGYYKQDESSTTNIFKTTDGGLTWTTVFTSNSSYWRGTIQDLKVNPLNFNTIYAGMESGGIYKSLDAGDTWTEFNAGIWDFSGRFEIGISPVDTNRIFASAEGQASQSRLWVSYNGGADWTHTIGEFADGWLWGQGWYSNTILCHPTDPDVVYVGGILLNKIQMTSTTTRETTLLDQEGVDSGHNNLALLPGDGDTPWRLLDANNGGVAVSTDGDSGWSMPIQGLNTTQFYGVDKKPGASAYVGGMEGNGTWRSPEDTDASDRWTFQIGSSGFETSWHFDDSQKIIGSQPYNLLQRSLNGGQTWEDATTGLGDTGSSGSPFLTKIAKSNHAPDLLYVVTAYGIWRSIDFGGSWMESTVTGNGWNQDGRFKDAKISRANPQVVWVGSRMDNIASIHLSTDNGMTFAPVPNYTTVTMGPISGISTHPTDDQVAYVLFSFSGRPKILRTSDRGASWEDITGFSAGAPSSNGFPDVAVWDLLVHPHETSTLWAGTEIGLFESTDNGVSWHLADNDLPNVGIWAMTHVEDEILIATHGRGLWTVEIPEMTAGQTYNPLLDTPFQRPLGGPLFVEPHLRSAYDSTQVVLDAVLVTTFPANAAGDRPSLEIPVLSDDTWDIQLKSYKDGMEYPSVLRTTVVFGPEEPLATYFNDFNELTDDFVGTDFSVRDWVNFDSPAIHSRHLYPNDSDPSYTLTKVIRVAEIDALLEFDEVVMVEPGSSGSRFGEPWFRDYVIVEGSSNRLDWIPLLDGYDSRDDPDWLNQWNGTGNGVPSLYRPRVIDLHDTFASGETILVRFRLHSDSDVRGWGWAIDNLSIQGGTATSTDGAPRQRFALDQNYPNPFNPSTVIRYELPRTERVSLKIYDQRGRLVRTLVEGEEAAGRKQVIWDGRAQSGARVASGIYFYQLFAGEATAQRKMTLVR